MIPLKDENPTRRTPFITLILIVASTAIWFFVQNDNPVTAVVGPQDEAGLLDQFEFNLRYAAIPCEITEFEPLTESEVPEPFGTGDCDTEAGGPVFEDKRVWLAMLTSMFLHGSLIHLLGNMLFLWIFGNNIEDKGGHTFYLGFYLVSGVVATLAHVALQPGSTIPLVGASGAIAGVMGAYLVLFPRAPIRTLIIFFFILFRDIPAWVLLGFWFVSQFFVNPNEGIAWAAHVGGFVFGVLVGLVWRAVRPPPQRAAVSWAPGY